MDTDSLTQLNAGDESVAPQKAKQQGIVAFRSGNYAEAVRMFTIALKAEANSHTLLSNRAAAYQSMGNYELALQDARQCILLQPTWLKGTEHASYGILLDQWNEYCFVDRTLSRGASFDGVTALSRGLACL